MDSDKFSEQQLAAISQLAEALKNCQQLGIHISGVSEFAVQLFEDAGGNDYAAIS
ncbi:MAG: hypothetical protein M3O71_21240 [Bacteroidota bacterium]|nr:hypothetical protein [Bacteroidota bacterium]